MTYTLIIIICSILLFAYLFDVSSAKTRIPSVILLLLLGFFLKETALIFNADIPDINQWLIIFGNLGLVLIVLEGAMELELKRNKLAFILRSFVMAFIPIVLLSSGIALVIYHSYQIPFKTALINALPVAVISSAIAIPSARRFSGEKREFVTYESSFSDITGVLAFDFLVKNNNVNSTSVAWFSLELIITAVITLLATLLLAFMLDKIKHHVKFIPIILLTILIYTISKSFHLPALIFILIFGMFIGNLRIFSSFRFMSNFGSVKLQRDVEKFREITAEGTFLVRSLFFILFGFHLEQSEIFNADSVVWAAGVTLAIFMIRILSLTFLKFPLNPLLYIAPRGLITVLLYISIPEELHIDALNRSFITQVIIFTALIMMVGLIPYREKNPFIPKANHE